MIKKGRDKHIEKIPDILIDNKMQNIVLCGTADTPRRVQEVLEVESTRGTHGDVDCISRRTHTLGKGLNPILLPLARGK